MSRCSDVLNYVIPKYRTLALDKWFHISCFMVSFFHFSYGFISNELA